MLKSGKGLPKDEDSAENEAQSFSERKWRRKRWRKRRGEPVVRCAACGVRLNRRDTYYVRPAYTDGEVWLCSGCYERLAEDPDHRYGRRGLES